TAGPTLFTTDEPGFAFGGDSLEYCPDGKGSPIGLLETVLAPKDLVPEKYTLFRRQIRPADPTIAAYVFADVPHNRAKFKTTIEKANVDLTEATSLIKAFEQAQGNNEVIDTNSPASKYYNKDTARAAPVPNFGING